MSHCSSVLEMEKIVPLSRGKRERDRFVEFTIELARILIIILLELGSMKGIFRHDEWRMELG